MDRFDCMTIADCCCLLFVYLKKSRTNIYKKFLKIKLNYNKRLTDTDMYRVTCYG